MELNSVQAALSHPPRDVGGVFNLMYVLDVLLSYVVFDMRRGAHDSQYGGRRIQPQRLWELQQLHVFRIRRRKYSK